MENMNSVGQNTRQKAHYIHSWNTVFRKTETSLNTAPLKVPVPELVVEPKGQQQT
jgi:hypothetical protein